MEDVMKPVKQIGTVKQYDWHRLTKDLMEALFINQQTMSEKCKVSQQSISNWKNHTRNPGIFAKQMLFNLAQKEKIDLSKYEINNAREAITRQFDKGNGKEITRLLELFGKMSKRARKKFLQIGNTLIK